MRDTASCGAGAGAGAGEGAGAGGAGGGAAGGGVAIGGSGAAGDRSHAEAAQTIAAPATRAAQGDRRRRMHHQSAEIADGSANAAGRGGLFARGC
jgi:hypothetical protein